MCAQNTKKHYISITYSRPGSKTTVVVLNTVLNT